MKILKLLSFSLITILFLGLLTACDQPVSVLDELGEDAEVLDTIDVDMSNGDVAEETEEELSFDPDVAPEISNGILVPTGFDATSLIFVSTMLGGIVAVWRRRA